MRAMALVILGLALIFSPAYRIMACPPRTNAVSRNGFALGLLSASSG